MSNIDDAIRKMGYEIKIEGSATNCYIVYDNIREDVQVEISWSEHDEDCYLHARSVTRQPDWLGHMEQEPRGLDYPAVKAFMAKIDEMRGKPCNDTERRPDHE